MTTIQLNLCNIPPWAISSALYNESPQPLEIQGVAHTARSLFEKLEQIENGEERGALFHDFMDVQFHLHQWEREETRNSRKALKNSYLRFLRGWLFDSSSIEGAVLKGWVESRLGLAPTWHHEVITDIHGEAYFRYTVDRMKGASRTSAIMPQLDLLYAFVQYELKRRFPDRTHMLLYRGVEGLTDHEIVEKKDKRHLRIRLNNLNSFTDDFERAWEFGSRVLVADVPMTKIFFCSGLLPRSLFKGEGEQMVIGGEFDVEVRTGGF